MKWLASLLLIFSCGAAARPTTVYLKGNIVEASLTPVLEKLRGTKEATLVITSAGGFIVDGLDFIQEVERLRAAEGLKVHCIVDLYAMSMAAIIFESGACDDRTVTDRSILMFHPVQAPPSAMTTALNHILAVIVSHRLGLTVPQYEEKIAHGDWILIAEQALAEHVTDRVIGPQ